MKVKCDHAHMLFRVELVLATQEASRKHRLPATHRSADRHREETVPAGYADDAVHGTDRYLETPISRQEQQQLQQQEEEGAADLAHDTEPADLLASQPLRNLQRNSSLKRPIGSPGATEATYTQQTVGSEGHVVMHRVSKLHRRLLDSQEDS